MIFSLELRYSSTTFSTFAVSSVVRGSLFPGQATNFQDLGWVIYRSCGSSRLPPAHDSSSRATAPCSARQSSKVPISHFNDRIFRDYASSELDFFDSSFNRLLTCTECLSVFASKAVFLRGGGDCPGQLVSG